MHKHTHANTYTHTCTTPPRLTLPLQHKGFVEQPLLLVRSRQAAEQNPHLGRKGNGGVDVLNA